jgi:Mlc titration factor MtfA (ptsG expression regulator)
MFLIVRKVVVGYGNLELKPEMAIVALSAQVQLTFGLRRFSLPRFKKIILYPEEFYSRFFGTKLKGLTTGAGFVTLSWKHTLEGFQDSTDNLNLALHEFAHALHIDLLLRESDDVKISKAFDKYGEQIRAHFKRLKPSGQEYLRDYGFSNKQEFFAVCVEHFFESPQEFQSNLSMLYTYFCKMLNQDPLNVYRDYSYEKSI